MVPRSSKPPDQKPGCQMLFIVLSSTGEKKQGYKEREKNEKNVRSTQKIENICDKTIKKE